METRKSPRQQWMQRLRAVADAPNRCAPPAKEHQDGSKKSSSMDVIRERDEIIVPPPLLSGRYFLLIGTGFHWMVVITAGSRPFPDRSN